MPTEIMPAKDAIARGRLNAYQRWGGREDKKWPNEAADRVKRGGAIEIGHRPKFKLRRGCSVFTIGSCFARNIEAKLVSAGIDVASARFSIPEGVYANDLARPENSVLNKFTAHAITYELARVLEGLTPPNRGLIKEEGDLWFDPQAALTAGLDWKTANILRDRIESTTAEIKHADAVFITLGLTEGWLDTETGVHLNNDMPIRHIRHYPNRFQFVNSGFGDVVEQVRRTITLIEKHGKPKAKVILTVSPVPLGTTFTDQDVIVANSYSKAVLRAVCQEMLTHDQVDYFPSFEMVIRSQPSLAWESDQRHVAPNLIDHVTRRFVELYVE